ncbi:uncharacterized protein RCO7_01140 [Rhynchosporium graminicola]|uniref:CPAF-like PDZ domain-containing protein n=1 Tax=Rhynchosporium graminicola TaxID=2792576 RepID=A0A1E1JVA6_9HELO|nr:uncharacterized protein RCO7_01140 [Rhynchosporium commune]
MKIPFISATVAVLAVGIVSASIAERQTATPCGTVAAAAQAWRKYKPNSNPHVNAEVAYACLISAPLNATAATELINSMIPYIEWQSSLSYLANPPKTYPFPAVDIFASLNTILKNIEKSVYAHEHAFQTDLLMLFQSVHDGHFRFSPDLLSKAVVFRRPVQVVSVSKDGVEVPKVYLKENIDAYVKTNITEMPSALSKVNGEAVQEFMAKLAQLGFLQDLDGLYNNLMYEMAFDAQSPTYRYMGYFALTGRYGYFYPGASTTLEFENGTTSTVENYAEVVGNLDGVTDGKSLYQRFCTGPNRQAASSTSAEVPHDFEAEEVQAVKTPPNGYPTPQVISSDLQVSGYFLNGTGYEDVAVLGLLSFSPSSPLEFQSIIQTLISDAKAAGKTKLVIDLSSNGGGNILAGYDAFRQLFPQIVQDGFSRLREHDAFKVMSTGISRYAANFSTNSEDSKNYFTHGSVLNYRYDLNVTDNKFATYEDKFAPQKINGDEYTNLLRWDLNDPSTTTNPTWGVGATITGYGDRQNFTQPFAAEDIIMVYDGYCASTCTLFSDFMRVQAGVKSIAMGGRPNSSPIQGVGGTRGANNYQYEYIRLLSSVALESATAEEQANWTKIINYTDLPQSRSTDCSVNVRDNILRAHIEDGTPAQFLHEPADCRLFYEPVMTSDVTSIWKRAADAAWGGRKCVAGALPQKKETRLERLKRSEEMKIRAASEGRQPVVERLVSAKMLSAAMNLAVGKKVPL